MTLTGATFLSSEFCFCSRALGIGRNRDGFRVTIQVEALKFGHVTTNTEMRGDALFCVFGKTRAKGRLAD